ncbi:hypothetical protein AB0406_34365, partial [Streptomyces sp. NPDC085659]
VDVGAELLLRLPGAPRRISFVNDADAFALGERLAEADARTVLALALHRLGEGEAAREALTRADDLVRALPYPAGAPHAAAVRALMETEPEAR